MFKAVGEAGVLAPPHPLVVREAAGALGLEVEEALGQGISIVEGLRDGKHGEKGKHKNKEMVKAASFGESALGNLPH